MIQPIKAWSGIQLRHQPFVKQLYHLYQHLDGPVAFMTNSLKSWTFTPSPPYVFSSFNTGVALFRQNYLAWPSLTSPLQTISTRCNLQFPALGDTSKSVKAQISKGICYLGKKKQQQWFLGTKMSLGYKKDVCPSMDHGKSIEYNTRSFTRKFKPRFQGCDEVPQARLVQHGLAYL